MTGSLGDWREEKREEIIEIKHMSFYKVILPLFLLMITLSSFAQTVDYEQKAIEHFFGSIFESEYATASDIQFSGCTRERITQFDFLKPCFEGGRLSDIYVKLETAARSRQPNKPLEIDLSGINGITFKKRKAKSKLELELSQAIEVEGNYYVEVDITQKKSSLSAYYLRIDKKGNLIDWCKTGVVY